jgi:hypothetical protein
MHQAWDEYVCPSGDEEKLKRKFENSGQKYCSWSVFKLLGVRVALLSQKLYGNGTLVKTSVSPPEWNWGVLSVTKK